MTPPSLRRVLADFGGVYFANGLVAFLFAASGPVAIILAVGTRGGLTPSDLSSWIFGAFFVNGLISIAFCWYFRQPLVFLWTIPGAVLVGPALAHLAWPEVIGAFVATGVLMLALGFSGWVRRAMQAVPMPIVMGMVAGVFLRFGLDMVFAFRDDPWIAAPMAAGFVALGAFPRLARIVPPLIGALAIGIVAVWALGRFAPGPETLLMVNPNVYRPAFSLRAMIELVVPLAITVLVVQNGQGITVLRSAGHTPPVDAITVACGAGAIVTAFAGAVPTCLTGPVNAIISSSGERARHYTAGILVGVLALGFGLFAPVFTRLMLGTPKAFIAALAGLAMLRVLQSAFTVSFRDRFALGALVTFLVTVADIPILSIGAPFWGLVSGYLASRLLEREDFAVRG
ncbi:MAG TPA: benzoate/H(+) symporter BenE family transporter [Burkholderiales bacterium]|nr:benzoate/H(+) symporter BenE family transporter [Burkholderiales bacterium]